MKLHISITGMLVHGHRDVCYDHYGLDLFSHDSNYTIRSFAKLHQDLEMMPKSSSRQLFDRSRSSSLFEAMLHGAEMSKTSLPPLFETPIPTTPLPPILNVQMDNAAKNNKNWFVFYF
jgi:hypothetical protein